MEFEEEDMSWLTQKSPSEDHISNVVSESGDDITICDNNVGGRIEEDMVIGDVSRVSLEPNDHSGIALS